METNDCIGFFTLPSCLYKLGQTFDGIEGFGLRAQGIQRFRPVQCENRNTVLIFELDTRQAALRGLE
jgi:hypothetical protein